MSPGATTGVARGGPVGPDPKLWLGLATDHRRLFDALEEGWLRPPGEGRGQSLGVGAFAPDEGVGDHPHSVRVRIRLDPTKLPGIRAHARSGGGWREIYASEISGAHSHLHWPGPLPTFALCGISVASEHDRNRLQGLAHETSNISVPPPTLETPGQLREAPPPDAPPAINTTFDLPEDLDAHQGAMSMAVWSVPRMEPWLQLLSESLDPNGLKLGRLAAELEASWWKAPPWGSRSLEPEGTLDMSLWQAATTVFRKSAGPGSFASEVLARRIYDAAAHSGPPAIRDRVSEWWFATERILSAESNISIAQWRDDPVGLAIQLVLARSEPERFVTWLEDLPDVPPGVAWSAAVLCGLLSGYRHLPAKLRGSAWRRQALAMQALRCSFRGEDLDRWPWLTDSAPHPARKGDEIHLVWDGEPILSKRASARGAWLDADIRTKGNEARAKKTARSLGWPCLSWDLKLARGNAPLSGTGAVKIAESSGNRQMEVTGGDVTIRLHQEPSWVEVLDEKRFRHCVLVEIGPVSTRPTLARFVARSAGQERPVHTEDVLAVPGLRYCRHFISVDEERDLLDRIEERGWDESMQRRVQHYGWRYDYKARRVDESHWLGVLPDWLDRLANRLVDAQLVPRKPDQVIVNEYREKQGIAKHFDAPTFEEHVAMVSLHEEWPMVFRRGGTGKRGTDGYYEQLLATRSVAILSGSARWHWTHEIPKRKKLPGSKTDRGRRVSLTFRRVRVGDECTPGNPSPGSASSCGVSGLTVRQRSATAEFRQRRDVSRQVAPPGREPGERRDSGSHVGSPPRLPFGSKK